MARYDVFLASALADREKAELVVRRLRALKFKVRYDKKREHTTPTPKDYRDVDNAASVLVLWSKQACDLNSADSDWVHAIAHHARSKDDALLQAALDTTVPDEPFSSDDRFALSGMGPRKLVEGYYELVDTLGDREGRSDLRDWLDLKASDTDGKEIWKENHPSDPLALVGKPKTAPQPKPAVAPAAVAAPAVAPGFAANLEAPAPKSTRAPEDRMGTIILATVGAVILAMLVLSAALRSHMLEPVPTNGDGTELVERCPAGQIPAYLLDQRVRPPLEPGPIIDDTEDE
ncbi:MAG: toll/interleukin-1 receptor domain-containing protein [Hyphomonadaceae bacterium]|nr:toll/interleukin-1 receptor domain-containing protein [Hyphomonadaceae bacterium]